MRIVESRPIEAVGSYSGGKDFAHPHATGRRSVGTGRHNDWGPLGQDFIPPPLAAIERVPALGESRLRNTYIARLPPARPRRSIQIVHQVAVVEVEMHVGKPGAAVARRPCAVCVGPNRLQIEPGQDSGHREDPPAELRHEEAVCPGGRHEVDLHLPADGMVSLFTVATPSSG